MDSSSLVDEYSSDSGRKQVLVSTSVGGLDGLEGFNPNMENSVRCLLSGLALPGIVDSVTLVPSLVSDGGTSDIKVVFRMLGDSALVEPEKHENKVRRCAFVSSTICAELSDVSVSQGLE